MRRASTFPNKCLSLVEGTRLHVQRDCSRAGFNSQKTPSLQYQSNGGEPAEQGELHRTETHTAESREARIRFEKRREMCWLLPPGSGIKIWRNSGSPAFQLKLKVMKSIGPGMAWASFQGGLRKAPNNFTGRRDHRPVSGFGFLSERRRMTRLLWLWGALKPNYKS